jgi:hypothetical protein
VIKKAAARAVDPQSKRPTVDVVRGLTEFSKAAPTAFNALLTFLGLMIGASRGVLRWFVISVFGSC